MVRETLIKISQLIGARSQLPKSLSGAVDGNEDTLWDYLISNELWGGAGSIADQALLEFPEERKQLERLMILLGTEQIKTNRVNVRTDMWVSVFQKLENR